MLRRVFLAGLLSPLCLVIALGCGQSGGAESPKVENSNVKPKPLKTKSGEDGGLKTKSFSPTD